MKYSELLRLVIKDGWYVVRHAGSHMIMRHSIKKGEISIPFHGSKEISKGLLKAILKKANINTNKR